MSDLTNWYDTGTCPVDSLDLQKHASLLMYRLFDWYDRNQHDFNQVDGSNKQVDECICLAFLIFMVFATGPNACSFGSRLSKVATKLHSRLQRVSMNSASPDILFWTLTIGALGAKSLPKNTQSSTISPILPFLTQYCHTVIGSVTCDGDRLLERMKTCLWVPLIFDEKVNRL